MPSRPTPEELNTCLAAIAEHPLGSGAAGSYPEDVYAAGPADARTIYLNFIAPASLSLGETYRTWVVQLRPGRGAAVSFFWSRRGAATDETLPASAA